MSKNLVIKDDINKGLRERFDPTVTTAYEKVIVLLLYWRYSDGDYKKEADQLKNLF